MHDGPAHTIKVKIRSQNPNSLDLTSQQPRNQAKAPQPKIQREPIQIINYMTSLIPTVSDQAIRSGTRPISACLVKSQQNQVDIKFK